jgi:membrane-associated protease RseP (regulator of RpoE activity)
MKVTEFFIGFGPRLWWFRKGETDYGLKPIPAGAYVRIVGMTNLEEVEPADEPRTYRQQSFPRRLSVAVAGSAMHFLMAIVLMFAVLVVFGLPDPDSDRWTVGGISEIDGQPAPAAVAGLEVGDRIVEVDGQRFDDYTSLRSYLRGHPDDVVQLVVERHGEELALAPRLAAVPDGGTEVGFLGIAPRYGVVKEDPVGGLVESVRLTGETMWLSVKGLGTLFSPSGVEGYVNTLTNDSEATEASQEMRPSSVVGIVKIGNDAAGAGASAVLSVLFAINVFIGVFNLTPLLPFDGGHVAIAVYERIRSRNGRRYFADIGKLMPLTYAVVAVLGLLFISSIWLDIARPADNIFQ